MPGSVREVRGAHGAALMELLAQAEDTETQGAQDQWEPPCRGGGRGCRKGKVFLKGPPRRASHGPSQHCVNITLVPCGVSGSVSAFLRASRSLAATSTSAALQEELENL